MQARRDFIKSLCAGLLAFAAGGLGFGQAAAARSLGGGPTILRHGAHFLVDGWVLTADDLRALNLPEPRTHDL